MNAPDEMKLLAAPAKTPAANVLEQWTSYWLDSMQRSVLFLDVLRERADNMLAHEQAGLPPLLDFEYETILDARRFQRPVNYALLRITGSGKDRIEDCLDEHKPPVVILDPRAGHGPGIGGFKRDSEVGMALHEGHAVYFVIFFPEPCPGQTLADVLHALRRFVEEIGRRHPGKPPVLYGNCQAGWAVMLLAADCEGLVGPVVLNGSPDASEANQSDTPLRQQVPEPALPSPLPEVVTRLRQLTRKRENHGDRQLGNWLTHFLRRVQHGDAKRCGGSRVD